MYNLFNLSSIFKKRIGYFAGEFRISFNTADVSSLKRIIIEKRVKEIIQSNNLLNIFKKIKSIFGLDLGLSKEDTDLLVLTSLNRNILTHNHGIINNIYLTEIKRFGLNSDRSEGDDLKKDLEKLLLELYNRMLVISGIIYGAIIEKALQLNNYSKKI